MASLGCSANRPTAARASRLLTDEQEALLGPHLVGAVLTSIALYFASSGSANAT
jgi:hypothetical protein